MATKSKDEQVFDAIKRADLATLVVAAESFARLEALLLGDGDDYTARDGRVYTGGLADQMRLADAAALIAENGGRS